MGLETLVVKKINLKIFWSNCACFLVLMHWKETTYKVRQAICNAIGEFFCWLHISTIFLLALQTDHVSISSKAGEDKYISKYKDCLYIFSKNWFFLLNSGHFYVDPLSASAKYLDSCFWNLQAVEASWYVTLRWLFHSRVLFSASPQWVQIIHKATTTMKDVSTGQWK